MFGFKKVEMPKPGDALTGLNKFHKLYFHKLGAEQAADAHAARSRQRAEKSQA